MVGTGKWGASNGSGVRKGADAHPAPVGVARVGVVEADSAMADEPLRLRTNAMTAVARLHDLSESGI